MHDINMNFRVPLHRMVSYSIHANWNLCLLYSFHVKDINLKKIVGVTVKDPGPLYKFHLVIVFLCGFLNEKHIDFNRIFGKKN